MAVSFTTKFYQDSIWKDISKIVFTSPNIDSPAAAGTRSHILPGQGNIGLWYEDSSYMYRIDDSQKTISTDFYNYIVTSTSDITIAPLSTSVTVTGTQDNYEIFQSYMKTGVGCSTIGYTAFDMNTDIQEIRVQLEYSDVDPENIITATTTSPGSVSMLLWGSTINFDTGDSYSVGWSREIISGVPECYFEIDLKAPKNITKIYMMGGYAWDNSGGTYLKRVFFGNYTIHAKLKATDDWELLYTGANTSSHEATIFLTSNTNFYRYYKLTILDSSGLGSGFSTSWYALSDLKFYAYEYNDIPTRNKPLYNFKENGDTDILYISDVNYLGNMAYSLTINNIDTSVSGTISAGTELKGWGSLSAGNLDFKMDDSIVFGITTGEAYDCRLTAWDDVTHSTTLNELIANDHVRVSALAFCCSNSEIDPQETFTPLNYVWGPVHNRVLKGNTVYGSQNLFYGDFDMVYRYQEDVYGDYLIFKPLLYGIDSSLSYGVHDYVITLSYSYT